MIKIDPKTISRKECINVGFLYEQAKKICKLTLKTEYNIFEKKNC
jgi:hypothetical protein